MEYNDSQKVGSKVYYNVGVDGDRTYPGVDLTVKFADEIKNYSDEWAWIKARKTAGNYAGLHVGDYIPITVSYTHLRAHET